MAHPRWPGFDTKTGNPIFDNKSARLNKQMYRATKKKIKLRGVVGRKRKKQLMRVEGGNYVKLLAAFYNDLANKHKREQEASR